MTVNSGFSKDYLCQIQEKFKIMDSLDNGGDGDGRVSINEAYNNLNTDSLFKDLKKGGDEYNTLKAYTDSIPQALKKYAGEDGVFSAEEWAKFLNGDEWGNVIKAYHSSSNFAELEMGWVDNKHISDGKTTKGEVKVGILNNLSSNGYKIDTSEIETIIDKYAGDDGTFSVEEYTALKNDETYKSFLDKYGVSPLYDNENIIDADVQSEELLECETKKGVFNKIADFIKGLFSS